MKHFYKKICTPERFFFLLQEHAFAAVKALFRATILRNTKYIYSILLWFLCLKKKVKTMPACYKLCYCPINCIKIWINLIHT